MSFFGGLFGSKKKKPVVEITFGAGNRWYIWVDDVRYGNGYDTREQAEALVPRAVGALTPRTNPMQFSKVSDLLKHHGWGHLEGAVLMPDVSADSDTFTVQKTFHGRDHRSRPDRRVRLLGSDGTNIELSGKDVRSWHIVRWPGHIALANSSLNRSVEESAVTYPGVPWMPAPADVNQLWPGTGGTAIPGRFPVRDFMWSQPQTLAGGSVYPPYSYEQFWRTNPGNPPGQKKKKTGYVVLTARDRFHASNWAAVQKHLIRAKGDARVFDSRGEEVGFDRNLRKMKGSVSALNPWPSYKPDETARNAGPFWPQLYPTGRPGYPMNYVEEAAKTNPRRKRR